MNKTLLGLVRGKEVYVKLSEFQEAVEDLKEVVITIRSQYGKESQKDWDILLKEIDKIFGLFNSQPVSEGRSKK